MLISISETDFLDALIVIEMSLFVLGFAPGSILSKELDGPRIEDLRGCGEE